LRTERTQDAMATEPTVEQLVERLAEDVELFTARAKPGVREIVVNDEVQAKVKAWRVDDIDVLATDYIDKLRGKRGAAYDDETRQVDRAIAPRFRPLREAIGQKMADARRLRSESERVDPSLNPERYVSAKLLDEFTLDRAERWLAERAADEVAIFERYQAAAADERRDVQFCLLVGKRYGVTDQAPGDSTSITSPLRRAVRARQDARVPPSLRTALDQLAKAEDGYKLARAEAFPSTENITKAIGATLRRAK
jgi:hypothetical protein